MREKLLQAIKAAETADHQLKQQGALPKNIRSRNDISALAPVLPDPDVVNEIETDAFVPKSFKSSKSKAADVKIEVKVEDGAVKAEDQKTVFHSSVSISCVFSVKSLCHLD